MLARVSSAQQLALALLGLLAASSCRPEQPPTPVPTPVPIETRAPAPEPAPAPFEWRHEYIAAEEAGVFALLEWGSRLHSDARDDSPFVEVDIRPGVVKVIAESPEFVEVQLGWEADPNVTHCRRAPFMDIGLRMFVRRDQLADVTTHSGSIELGEGVGINFAPGVLVEAAAEPNVVTLTANDLTTGSFHLTFAPELVAAHVGKLYVPARSSSFPDTLDQQLEGILTYGDYEVQHQRWEGVYAIDAADPNHVLIGASCLRVAGWMRPGAPPGRSSGGGGCGIAAKQFWRIQAGAALQWADGRPAGHTLEEFHFYGRPRSKGKLRCFSLRLNCNEIPELCVAKDAIAEAPDPLDIVLRMVDEG
jgi:hypothetical protein